MGIRRGLGVVLSLSIAHIWCVMLQPAKAAPVDPQYEHKRNGIVSPCMTKGMELKKFKLDNVFAYCGCYADHLLAAMTAEELQEKGTSFSPALTAKMQNATNVCAPKLVN